MTAATIDPTIAEAWFDMARDVQARFYDKASRYTTSAFMRLKLGDALQRREMAPHVFEIRGRGGRTAPAHRRVTPRLASYLGLSLSGFHRLAYWEWGPPRRRAHAGLRARPDPPGRATSTSWRGPLPARAGG